MNKTPLTVAGVIFLAISLLHLSRIVFKFDVAINGTTIPLWANGLGFVIAGALGFWMLQRAKKGG